ncbi:hypothetical protein ACW9H6_11795 [Pseudomonas sp. SDO528_S397]
MRVFPKALLLVNVMALGMPLAWAQSGPPGTPQLASDPPSWSWKNQDKPANTYNPYKPSNAGSWKPQSGASAESDAENPINEGEDSESYDDGNK